MSKIKVGSKVMHKNLVCYVKSVASNYYELQPVGSSVIFSAPVHEVTKIMNEGTRSNFESPLNS